MILRLEEESAKLDEARRQAEDANRSKTEFLGRMSHELRTPLNSVLGFTNVLLKKMKLEPGSRELDFLQRIRLNGMHLLDLVNDLLDLNRIEEGEMTVDLRELDLGSLIEETVDRLEGWGVNEHVTTQLVVPPELEPIRADESRLRQVPARRDPGSCGARGGRGALGGRGPRCAGRDGHGARPPRLHPAAPG